MTDLLRLHVARWILLLSLAPALVAPADASEPPPETTPEPTPEEVTWWTPVFPPLVIVDGPAKGQGSADAMLALTAEKAPHLTFRRVTTSLTRGFRMFSDGQPACNPAIIPTAERMKTAFFTVALLEPGFAFVVRRDDPRLSQQLGPTPSLQAALALPGLNGGVVSGRSYSPALDRVLATAPTLYRASSSSDSADPALRMLAGGRIDYTLEYPSVVAYDESLSGGVTLFSTLPIAESAQPVLIGFACPRTDWGRRIIGQIDEILRAAAPTERFHDIQTRWTPQDRRLGMAAALTAFLRRRAAGPWHNLNSDGADLLVAPQ